MKYVVTGTRHPSEVLSDIARRFVAETLIPGEDDEVDGEAIGIDTVCGDTANSLGITRHKFGVERVYGKNAWERYGRGVGHMRNALMIDEAGDCRVVGFWNGYSKGTRGCLEYAEKQNKLWRIYFENGWIWSSDQAWDWRTYGDFMATKMYRASRMTKALDEIITRLEDRFEIKDPDRMQIWINAAREGYNTLMDGVRPFRHSGTMVFASKSKKGSGHRVHAHECSCNAATFNRPCWARAAAELLNILEVPPEYNTLEKRYAARSISSTPSWP